MLKGVYQPRHAKVTTLYQCISNHFQEFESLYPEKYQERYGFYRPVIQKVVEKFLDCGDLTQGFARIKCGQCQHEYLLAFSCKGRYFCPSCHQKRVLQFGEWVTEQVLAPIPHRQYVFTIPKILRVYFRKDRRLLGKLSQCAYECLKVFFQATLRRKNAVPRVIVAIQTFGDLVNFHLHLHAIVFDGLFAPNGWFYMLPKIDLKKLEALFRHRVLKMLLREGKIDEALIKKLLGWRHSGFSIHHQVRIGSQDQPGREKLAQYILRSPFSQQKMRYHPKSKTVLYRSKMNPVLKRNFEVFPVLDWIAALTAHIPNQGEHLVRYYGYYSNASRGKRKKAQDQAQQAAPEGTVEIAPPLVSPALKQRWAELIKEVYEADPLVCPRCGGSMRILAFIDQSEIIEKILTHLGLWPYPAHAPPDSAVA
jgi:transposase-like protein